MSIKKFFSLLLVSSAMISGTAYCDDIHHCPSGQAWVESDNMCEGSCPQGQAWVQADKMCEGSCPQGQAWANEKCAVISNPDTLSILNITPASLSNKNPTNTKPNPKKDL